MLSALRIVTVLALAPWLAVSAVLAREHVHESDAAGHASAPHSHFGPHAQAGTHVAHLDHDAAELGDVDGPVVWLDNVGIPEAPHALAHDVLLVSTPSVL